MVDCYTVKTPFCFARFKRVCPYGIVSVRNQQHLHDEDLLRATYYSG